MSFWCMGVEQPQCVHRSLTDYIKLHEVRFCLHFCLHFCFIIHRSISVVRSVRENERGNKMKPNFDSLYVIFVHYRQTKSLM